MCMLERTNLRFALASPIVPWYDDPMAINAIAIVHIDPSAVKSALDPAPEREKAKLADDRLDVLEGADGKYYVIESFDDATAIHLGIPLGYADPDVMGTLVAVALGDIIDEHDDVRGVPLYPESYRPKARTWDGLLEEIGEALDWVPIEGTEIVDPAQDLGGLGPDAGELAAIAAQLQAQLPPDMLQQAMQMAQKLAGSGAMDEIQRAMQQMMPDTSSGNVSPMGMDMQAMAQQAQKMLNDNPELQKRLASQFGITDAQLEDDDDK